MQMLHVTKIGICTPIPAIEGPAGPRLAPVTTEWHRARLMLLPPFGYNLTEIVSDGQEVGEARCMAMARAMEMGLKYLFFLDWDVLVPTGALHRLVQRLDNLPDHDAIAGVYCVKVSPPCPLIYKGWGEGPFWDWTPGDLLTEGIASTGMGCTLIRVDSVRKMNHSPDNPWFKTLKMLERIGETDHRVEMTEDHWFFKRLEQEIGPNRVAIDTGLICSHIDPNDGRQYVLPDDCIPMKRLRAKTEAANE